MPSRMRSSSVVSPCVRASREHFERSRWQSKQAVREAATICPRPCDLDIWPFDLENSVRVTCDVGYLCANFSLPRPLCFGLRPDIRDIHRQTYIQTDRRTDVRQHHRLMHPPSGAGITDDVLIRERKLFSSSFLILDFLAENAAKLHILDTILTLIISQGSMHIHMKWIIFTPRCQSFIVKR